MVEGDFGLGGVHGTVSSAEVEGLFPKFLDDGIEGAIKCFAVFGVILVLMFKKRWGVVVLGEEFMEGDVGFLNWDIRVWTVFPKGVNGV